MKAFFDKFRKAFHWSWIVTVPVTMLFLVWIIGVIPKYWDFGLRYRTYANAAKLKNIGEMEFKHLLRKLQLKFIPDLSHSEQSLQQINLIVEGAAEAELNRNLPHSGRNYVKAQLMYPDGKIHKVKMKYRGDFHWHWAFYKKSIRVKTKKGSLFLGMRAFNLIAPKFPAQINNFLAYRLAMYMRLLSPRAQMVNVYINGENRGVHLLVEQLKEMTLRYNDRMPGDLYAGELIGRDKYFAISNHVFKHPRLWNKISINNHYAEDAYAPLEKLCGLLASKRNKEVMAELRNLVDLEAFGRFSAFRMLIQSYHYGNTHNWRLYYDPWRNVFEPLVWDPNGWHPRSIPKDRERANPDIITSLLDEVLWKDQQFILARHKAIHEFFSSGLDKVFLAEVDDVMHSVGIAVKKDPSLVSMHKSLTPEEVIASMRRLRNQIEAINEDIRDTYFGDPGKLIYRVSSNDKASVQLLVDGRQPISRLQIECASPPQEPLYAHISFWVDGQERKVDISGAITLNGKSILIDLPLLARFSERGEKKYPVMKQSVMVKPAYYELNLGGISSNKNYVQDIDVSQGGAAGLRAEKVENIAKIEFKDTYGIVLPKPVKKEKTWQGSLSFEGVHRIQNDIEIKPGTILRMGKGASLIIEGRVLANGTEKKPIRILAQDQKQRRWGVFALRGPKAEGSVLNYCEFSGGSGLKSDLYEYSAMFSVHDVKRVQVNNCFFRDSRVVDDMVHGVYSEIRFENCTFEGAPFDAVDLDICTAVVEDCNFLNNGNDSLDLMTSNVVVNDTLFKKSGDKGISVGEGSNLLAINVKFTENKIGVQAKDSSECTLYNAEFINNRMAVDAYKKNWRYGGGGTVRLYKSHLYDNDSNFTADKKSKISIYDSFVNGDIKDKKRIVVDPTVDSKSSRKARVNTRWLYPEDSKSAQGLFNPYWAAAKPSIRGSYDAE